ncbi:MAG: hypothetical protein CMI32_00725 [Opitutales bacterium]|jgi:hypothetical protein|nr:hypothetical protein [Opitutales bacterium]|tara:strand:- start:1382 stop:2764 length:1383 start_codon:yes stop_codon:yes gene_type:complete
MSRATEQDCPRFYRSRAIDRRGFVKAGALGMTGLTLADFLKAESQADPSKTSRDKAVIILWKRGGPSQHETWDPKPDAPQAYRGAFGAMPTKVPGIHICDLLPKCAKVMDKFSIIRTLHHTDAGHSAGDQIMFTGYPPSKANPNENVYPSCGSIVAKQMGHLNPDLPSYVMIPRRLPGVDPAYLGKKYAPFETLTDPARKGPFKLPNFTLGDTLSLNRLDSRKGLLKAFDQLRRDADGSGAMEAADSFTQQAFDVLTSPKARTAFDLEAEPRSIRERYGFMPEYKAPTPDRCGVPAWSQRMLLARRLVEAGVRLVTVDLRWWDTHVKGYETMRDGFLPRWDQAYSALLEDLDQRGLMDDVMVIAWGEFGRTPKVNSTGGRDHYPNVFSAAVAGGGIQGGRAIGESDSKGAEPKERPVQPQDVLATMYRHLGIDTKMRYASFTGLPSPVLPFGDPIDELFS